MTLQNPKLKKSDWVWLLAYPLYQVVGTMRHEVSHGLVAWLEGATITRFVFWPTVDPQRGFRWGYIQFSGPTSVLTLAAPYLADLLTFGLVFWLCMRVRFGRRWLTPPTIILAVCGEPTTSAVCCRCCRRRQYMLAWCWRSRSMASACGLYSNALCLCLS